MEREDERLKGDMINKTVKTKSIKDGIKEGMNTRKSMLNCALFRLQFCDLRKLSTVTSVLSGSIDNTES